MTVNTSHQTVCCASCGRESSRGNYAVPGLNAGWPPLGTVRMVEICSSCRLPLKETA